MMQNQKLHLAYFYSHGKNFLILNLNINEDKNKLRNLIKYCNLFVQTKVSFYVPHSRVAFIIEYSF